MGKRVSMAVENFISGYNCAQSVVLAFADIYNLDEETALRVSASFGAGIGRMRQTCGAACGMFILAGCEKAAIDPKDSISKKENYELVQTLAKCFKEENGTLICGEHSNNENNGNDGNNGNAFTPKPEERTKEYYKKRPCVKMVESGARIFSEYLKKYSNK